MSRLRGDLRAQTSNLGPAVIFALLAIWAFAPLVSLIVYVGQHGGVLTGANGVDAFDQMAYLAWIRDEGGHLLASNLWVLGPTPHDYVHPMYVVSGLLWRIGLGVQLSYLIWKPVALLVMFFGFAAYVRHLLPGRRGQQAVALFLALFYASPVPAVANWTGHLSAIHRLQLTLATTDANSALNLWGFEHTAIAIGLMPVFLILAERLIAPRRSGPSDSARLGGPGRPGRFARVLAAPVAGADAAGDRGRPLRCSSHRAGATSRWRFPRSPRYCR